jgi:four helix bundle protein
VARSYRELLVWQKAKTLAVRIYESTEQFPRAETYGLRSQIRRAAVSVASNIAEGQGRLTSGEFLHFLGQARDHCSSSTRNWRSPATSRILIQPHKRL